MTSYPRPRANVGRTLAMQLKRNLRLRLQFSTVSTGRWNPGSLPMPHSPLSKPVRPHGYGAFGSMTLVHCSVYTIIAKKSILTKRGSSESSAIKLRNRAEFSKLRRSSLNNILGALEKELLELASNPQRKNILPEALECSFRSSTKPLHNISAVPWLLIAHVRWQRLLEQLSSIL